MKLDFQETSSYFQTRRAFIYLFISILVREQINKEPVLQFSDRN